VTLDENLVDGNGATTIAATNLFVRDHEGEWKLVTHHGSPVMNR
jgi:ketosteroid isomerase-like protein